MNVLIKGARLIDPATGFDQVGDLAVVDGHIAGLGAAPAQFVAQRVIDAHGCVAMPGLIDLCARLREPGHEHEGFLESELGAAAAGGVTSLVCPPDTDPALDEPGLVEMLKARARKLGRCRLFPLGALTRGLQGQSLTEMAELSQAGCVGFSQAEEAVVDTAVMLRAMQYAATYGYTVWIRPQEKWLGRGVAASGPVATRLGLSTVPVAAETIALNTTFELMRITGARVHLCRLSSAAGVELVRQAKAQGLPVTADVSINSLHLTDADIGFFNADMRLTPVLRQQRDRDALSAGLADGTLDALVSDHLPVGADEKQLPFAEATAGATGLELLLSLALKWGQSAHLPLSKVLSVVTSRPAAVLGHAWGRLGRSAGQLVPGGVADVCIFNPDHTWAVEPGALRSQSKHTPFSFVHGGTLMPARVMATLVAGSIAYERQ